MDITVRKKEAARTQGRGFPAGPPAGFRIGEAGRVDAVYSEDHTADVFLQTGVFLKRVPVRSAGWVVYDEDSGKGRNAGGRDLPPLGSRVFVLMPSGTYDDCFVLCSLFSTPDEAAPFLGEEKEGTRELVDPSGWHFTQDNATGGFKAASPDGKTSAGFDRDGTAGLELFGEAKLRHEKGGGTVFEAFDSTVTLKPGEAVVEHQGSTITLKSGEVTIKTSGTITHDAPAYKFTGSSSQGSVNPDPAGGGVYCAIKICPFSGQPHTG